MSNYRIIRTPLELFLKIKVRLADLEKYLKHLGKPGTKKSWDIYRIFLHYTP